MELPTKVLSTAKFRRATAGRGATFSNRDVSGPQIAPLLLLVKSFLADQERLLVKSFCKNYPPELGTAEIVRIGPQRRPPFTYLHSISTVWVLDEEATETTELSWRVDHARDGDAANSFASATRQIVFGRTAEFKNLSIPCEAVHGCRLSELCPNFCPRRPLINKVMRIYK
jgi:hypothetical protein